MNEAAVTPTSTPAGAAPAHAGHGPGHAHEPFPLDAARVGMLAFLVTEVAFFSTLLVTYLVYLEKSRPVAAEVLTLPLVLAGSFCLFSSSATVHLATSALAAGREKTFQAWWALTILLGALFLAGTALEWKELIVERGVTIGQSIFGTTYFTLVGFHAFHVTVGVILLTLMLALSWAGQVSARNPTAPELVSWYWHFVDAVWVFVFSIVYLLGR